MASKFEKYHRTTFDDAKKQQASQPTVFQQQATTQNEKAYQQANKTTGVSRSAYNNIQKNKSSGKSNSKSSSKSGSSSKSNNSSSGNSGNSFRAELKRNNLFSALGSATEKRSSTKGIEVFRQQKYTANTPYQRARNTTGISRAAFDAVQKQKERKLKNYRLFPISSMYSFPTVQKEIALRPQKTFQARQEMNNKYGIDTDSFNIKDFKQWARKYGVAVDTSFGTHIKESWSHDVSKETLEDAHKLLTLAKNNRNLNMSTSEVFGTHALDAATFGISTKVSDSILRNYSRQNHNNELLYGQTAKGAEYMALNRERHPNAALLGEIGGTLASTAATTAVGGAVAGAGRLAAAPIWVRAAVSQGVGFAVNEGLQTAGHGGSAKDVLVNSARAGAAGAVGGGVQAKVGSALGNVLFDKGLQNKIAPEIARNAIASASDAAAQSGLNSMLYSKDNKPTLEDATKDVLVAFAFGAIYSAEDTIKLSKHSKVQLDNLTDKVNADYQALVRKANKGYSESGNFNDELASLSGNIEEYSRAVRDYLDGYGYYGKIDGNLVDLEPGARFVGQDKQVKAMRDSLNTIISRTQEIRSAASKFGQLKLDSGSVMSAADDAFRAGLSHSSAVRGHNFTKRLAQNIGTDVNISKRVFVPGTRDEVNGFANVADNKIALSRNADFGMTPAQMAAHEGGHIAATKAPEKFGEYSRAALDAAMRNNKDLLGKHIESLRARGYSPKEIDEEIAAELTAPFADSQAVINALAKDTPQLAKNGLKMISRIKATLKDLSGNSYTAPNGLKLTFRDIDEMGFKYARAINAADRVDENPTKIKKDGSQYGPMQKASPIRRKPSFEIPYNGQPSALWSDVRTAALKKGISTDMLSYTGNNVNTSNENNSDIRESRKNNYVALHNIDENKLRSAFELGGLAMPSLAVTKTGHQHSGFGDITLVFGRDTIDPQTNSNNKLYGGDAYTPVFPQVVNAPIESEVKKLANHIGVSENYLNDNFFSGKTKDTAVTAMMKDANIKSVFARDTGLKVKPVLRMPKMIYPFHNSEAARRYISGKTFEDILSDPEGYISAISNLGLKNGFGSGIRARRVEKARDFLESAKHSYAEAKTSYDKDRSIALGTAVPTADAYSYRDGLDNLIETHMAEYTQYVKNIADRVMGEKQIRNNNDFHNPDGSPRSFGELHDKYSLDNVVRNMRAALQKGESSFMTGANNVRGAVTRNFSSIDDMKSDGGRIRNLSNEEADAIRHDFSDRLANIADEAAPHGEGNYLNDFSQMLIEIINESDSVTDFRARLKGNGYYNISDLTLSKIEKLMHDMSSAPTKYFEAKPQRAVGFNEVKAAVVPNGTSNDIINKLQQHGIRVVSYPNGDEAARTAAIEELDGVRFSRKSAPVDENGNKMKLSQLSKNSMHKEHYSDEFRAEADKRKNDFYYKKHSNEQDYNNAVKRIEEIGADKVLNELYRTEKWGAEHTADALALVEHFNRSKDYSSAVDVYELARKHTTQAAQSVQAWAIIDRLTPEGQYIALQRDNQKLIDKQVEEMGDKKRAEYEKKLKKAKKLEQKRQAVAKQRKKLDEIQLQIEELIEEAPQQFEDTIEKTQKRKTTKKTSNEFLDRLRATAGINTANNAPKQTQAPSKNQTKKRVFGQSDNAVATKKKSVAIKNTAVGQSFLEKLRTAAGVQMDNPNLRYSRKMFADMISTKDRSRMDAWLESGDVESAAAFFDTVDIDKLTPGDKTFLADYAERLDAALNVPKNVFTDADRKELYRRLRKGDYSGAEDMMNGFELDKLTDSDKQFVTEWADEYESRLERLETDNPHAQKDVIPLGEPIYSPTTKELLSKSDAVITEIETHGSADDMGHIEDLNGVFKDLKNRIRNFSWFNKDIRNTDEEFAEQFGDLYGRITTDTLKKGRSYSTHYMEQQLLVMENLDKVFENGKVIKVTKTGKENDSIECVYTLLSPVRFKYQTENGTEYRESVVKLNVQEYKKSDRPNRIHENKLLGVEDIDIQEKEPNTSKAVASNNDVGGHSVSDSYTMSIAQMLDFVKGFDIKYLPDDYFTAAERNKRSLGNKSPANGKHVFGKPKHSDASKQNNSYKKLSRVDLSKYVFNPKAHNAKPNEAHEVIPPEKFGIYSNYMEGDPAEQTEQKKRAEMQQRRRLLKENEAEYDRMLHEYYKELGEESKAATELRKYYDSNNYLDEEEYLSRNHVDELNREYNIHAISGEQLSQVYETITTINEIQTKEDLINKIIQQSKERHTATDNPLDKAVRTLMGKITHKNYAGPVARSLQKEDVEFLREAAIKQLFGKLADAQPTKFWDKVKTARVEFLLLNVRTNDRNIAGNLAFGPAYHVSSIPAAIVDKAMSLVTGTRTVAIDMGLFRTGNFSARNASARRTKIGINLNIDVGSDARYGIDGAARRTFKKGIGSALERQMGYMLNVTDEWTKGGARYNAAEGLRRMRDKDIAKLEQRMRNQRDKGENSFTDEEIHEFAVDNASVKWNDEQIKEIAEYEAKYATFQDDSYPAKLLRLLNELGNKAAGIKDSDGRVMFGAGDLIQPFYTVNGNLIARSVEFSPAGYLKLIYHVVKATHDKVKGSSFSPEMQRNIAMTFGRATTGVGLLALSVMLAKTGLLVTDYRDDSDLQRKFKFLEGIDGIKLNLSALKRLITGQHKEDWASVRQNDTLFGLDFAQPYDIILMYGAELNKVLSGESGFKDVVKETGKILTAKTFDQALDTASMQTIKSIADAYTYDGPTGAVTEFAVSSITSFIPAIVRQTASFLDKKARNAYTAETLPGRVGDRIKVNIPGLRETVPERVTWFGDTKTNTTGNRATDFATKFASPGSISHVQSTDVSAELQRLSEFDDTVFPGVAPKKFEGYTLFSNEYEEWSKMYGKKVYQYIKDVMSSEYYDKFDDYKKAEIVKNAITQADHSAKDMWKTAHPLEGDEDAPLNLVEAEQKRLEGLKDPEAISEKSGLFITYDDVDYELTPAQRMEYEYRLENKIYEYQDALVSGTKTVENVVGEYKPTWYYDEIPEDKRKKYIAEYDHKVANARGGKKKSKVELQAEYRDNKERFINGELGKEIEVSGQYSDLPDRIKKQVLGRASSIATKDVQAEMKDAIVSGVSSSDAKPATDTGRRVFGKSDTSGKKSLATAFREEMANTRRAFGLPEQAAKQRIAFSYAPPIGKTAASTAATPAATKATTSGNSGSRKRSGSSRRSSSGGSSRKSSGGGSRASSGSGSGYRTVSPTLVSAAAQTYSNTSPTISSTSSGSSYRPSGSTKKYDTKTTAAISLRYHSEYFVPIVLKNTRIRDIIPQGLTLRRDDGSVVNADGFFNELSPDLQQLVIEALQKQAESDIVGDVV